MDGCNSRKICFGANLLWAAAGVSAVGLLTVAVMAIVKPQWFSASFPSKWTPRIVRNLGVGGVVGGSLITIASAILLIKPQAKKEKGSGGELNQVTVQENVTQSKSDAKADGDNDIALGGSENLEIDNSTNSTVVSEDSIINNEVESPIPLVRVFDPIEVAPPGWKCEISPLHEQVILYMRVALQKLNDMNQGITDDDNGRSILFKLTVMAMLEDAVISNSCHSDSVGNYIPEMVIAGVVVNAPITMELEGEEIYTLNGGHPLFNQVKVLVDPLDIKRRYDRLDSNGKLNLINQIASNNNNNIIVVADDLEKDIARLAESLQNAFRRGVSLTKNDQDLVSGVEFYNKNSIDMEVSLFMFYNTAFSRQLEDINCTYDHIISINFINTTRRVMMCCIINGSRIEITGSGYIIRDDDDIFVEVEGFIDSNGKKYFYSNALSGPGALTAEENDLTIQVFSKKQEIEQLTIDQLSGKAEDLSDDQKELISLLDNYVKSLEDCYPFSDWSGRISIYYDNQGRWNDLPGDRKRKAGSLLTSEGVFPGMKFVSGGQSWYPASCGWMSLYFARNGNTKFIANNISIFTKNVILEINNNRILYQDGFIPEDAGFSGELELFYWLQILLQQPDHRNQLWINGLILLAASRQMKRTIKVFHENGNYPVHTYEYDEQKKELGQPIPHMVYNEEAQDANPICLLLNGVHYYALIPG